MLFFSLGTAVIARYFLFFFGADIHSVGVEGGTWERPVMTSLVTPRHSSLYRYTVLLGTSTPSVN